MQGRLLLAVCVWLGAAPAAAQDWFLNSTGPGIPYQIWIFGHDGHPRAAAPVISAGQDIRHAAWPSAIRLGGEIRVYASVYDGARWNELRLWTSRDGVSFIPKGSVFSANRSERHGIGPAQVIYTPGKTEPFTLYYLVRGPGGPGPSIHVATSADGVNWSRRGAVISADLPEEAGGLAMSYACRKADGNYALFYHAYTKDQQKGVAVVATGPDATRPFSNKVVILRGDDVSAQFSGQADDEHGIVGEAETVPLGIPLVIVAKGSQEVAIAVRQEGRRVWLERALEATYSDAALYTGSRRKVDPSYAQEQPDGSWRGIFTVYGAAPGITAEYTTELMAPALSGPWTFAGTGLRFKPYFAGGQWSTENPTPLVSSDSCSN